ncbi:MAG: hypothetical protein RLO81_13745 [Fulvivirga sp.]|uniref:hypothetical protein n=1 Tax=Fulvivirga sp. TaxID=1931237 RepID=UPI0032EF88A8
MGKNFMQRPASFVVTSSNDMIKYLDMLLSAHSDTNSNVKLSSIERMENGQTGYHSKMAMPGRYGLGNKPGLRNVRLHGHSGNAWNFADLTYNREAGIGYYVATNCSYPIPKIRRLLNEFLLQDFKSKSDLSLTEDASLAKPFEGFYEVINSRNEHMLFFDKIRFGGELKVVDDKVLFDGGLKPREYKILSNSNPGLVSLSQHGEQFENQKYMASLSLMKDDNGDDMIIWDGGTSMHYFKRQSYLVHLFRSIGLFGSTIILLASALLFISAFVYQKIKSRTALGFEVLMSTMLLIKLGTMIYIFISKNPFELIALGEMNIKTVMFFLFSISFPLITGAFIMLVIKNFKEYKLSIKCVLFLNLFAASYLSYFLYSNHFIGLQFWNY